MAKILIADDEQILVKILEKEFTFNGFEVEVASDGSEALQKIKTSKPDLVLLDIMMPMMDGITVFKKMLEDSEMSKIPVVFLSGLGEEIAGFVGQDKEIMNKAAGYWEKGQYSPQQTVDGVKKILGLDVVKQ